MILVAYCNERQVNVFENPGEHEVQLAGWVADDDELEGPAAWHGVNLDEADSILEAKLGYVAGEWTWLPDCELYTATVAKL